MVAAIAVLTCIVGCVFTVSLDHNALFAGCDGELAQMSEKAQTPRSLIPGNR
jgi:hypothetical protein